MMVATMILVAWVGVSHLDDDDDDDGDDDDYSYHSHE